MTRVLDADIPVRYTADNVAVKRGDVVWQIRTSSAPARKTITRDTLKMWAYWKLHDNHFADESLALVAAKTAAEKRLAKAKSALANETRTLAKIAARTLAKIAARLVASRQTADEEK